MNMKLEKIKQQEVLQGRLAQDTKCSKTRLKPEQKAAVAFSPQPSREVAAENGLHHSRVCELRREARDAACEHWEGRRPGPKVDSPDWQAKNAELEAALAEVSHERDLLAMRRDWLELQLSWEHEREQEEASTECAPRTRKKNAKKHQHKSKRSSH